MVRSTPVFGDPKTDFVFQRIFGSEDHQTALLGFLTDILQLDGAHRIASVALLAAGMAIQNERGALAFAERHGELKARRDTLLRLLVRAGISLTHDDRTRIQACADTAILDGWIDNVFGAKTAVDVLT